MGVIAITGATGFIGGHLLQALGGHPVRVLLRRPRAMPADIETVTGHLGDADALHRLVAGADVVVHLGAAVKARTKAEFFAVNTAGTELLLAAVAAEAPGARLVHVSSLAARAPHLSPYAASKRAAEDAVLASGLPATIVRPPGVYGPGDREILALLRAAMRGWLPVPGEAGNRVSLLYGPDLGAMLAKLAVEGSGTGTILEPHDGTAAGYSYGELAAILSEVAGRPVRPLVVPPALLRGAGALNGLLARLAGRPAMLTAAKARELLHPDWVAGKDAAISALLRPTGLAQGLGATLADARARGLL